MNPKRLFLGRFRQKKRSGVKEIKTEIHNGAIHVWFNPVRNKKTQLPTHHPLQEQQSGQEPSVWVWGAGSLRGADLRRRSFCEFLRVFTFEVFVFALLFAL